EPDGPGQPVPREGVRALRRGLPRVRRRVRPPRQRALPRLREGLPALREGVRADGGDGGQERRLRRPVAEAHIPCRTRTEWSDRGASSPYSPPESSRVAR